jgi:hypothetical protein
MPARALSGFPDLLQQQEGKQIQKIRIAKRFYQDRICSKAVGAALDLEPGF